VFLQESLAVCYISPVSHRQFASPRLPLYCCAVCAHSTKPPTDVGDDASNSRPLNISTRISKNCPMLLSCFLTRRTARACSLSHRRVRRPRLRLIQAGTQGLPTSYLRTSSGTIKYDLASREVGCELQRSNNSGRSLDIPAAVRTHEPEHSVSENLAAKPQEVGPHMDGLARANREKARTRNE